MSTQTVAVVGTAGGVGTTRLTVEFGATLARAGREVAVFDAAFATQGLASYVPVQDADATALVTGDAQLGDTLATLPLDVPGRVAMCPARAPFERLARAKTAGAAERFERQLAAAALSHDVVLVDTPPLAANQALAAVNTADRIAVVAEPGQRGRDALAATHERLTDVGETADTVLLNRADDGTVADADAHVPTADVTEPQSAPAVVPPDETVAPAVADAVETALDTSLELEFPESGRLGGLV